MSKRIDVASNVPLIGTLYPPPFDKRCRARERKRLGDVAGLIKIGVNLLRLPPGTWSIQRHWHTAADEFVYIVSADAVLVTGEGPEILRIGDAVGFKAGDKNGHCLQNRSEIEAVVLEIGSRLPSEAAHYCDLDMISPAGRNPAIYARRDGTPFADAPRRGSEG
jgi:uncharacterized cupin superfamily protein